MSNPESGVTLTVCGWHRMRKQTQDAIRHLGEHVAKLHREDKLQDLLDEHDESISDQEADA